MDDADLALRRATYGLLAGLGRPPLRSEVAAATGLDAAGVTEGWRRLHAVRALVLDPATDEIRMANPFSAVPTAFRVRAAGRWWDANCAWDALGVCAALHVDGRVETACPDCGEPIAFDVVDERPGDEGLLFHCPVPAAHWWDDIVFT